LVLESSSNGPKEEGEGLLVVSRINAFDVEEKDIGHGSAAILL